MPIFCILAGSASTYLKPDQNHTFNSIHNRINRLWLVLLFLVFLVPSYAQNTKGDQPSKPTRESKFKSKTKKKKKGEGKRVKSNRRSQASSGRQGPNEKGRAWKSGDITGRKIPARRSKGKKVSNVHPQGGNTVKGSSGKVDDSPSGKGFTSKRIRPRTPTGQTRNVYPQSGPYVKKTRPPKSDDKPLKFNTGTSSQPKIRSTSGRARNVFPQKGPYVAKTRPPSKGDVPKWTGRKGIKSNVRSTSGKSKNVFPTRGSYGVRTRQPAKGDAPIKWTGSTVSKQRVRKPSDKSKNVYNRRDSYVAKTKPSTKGDGSIKWKGSAVMKPSARTATGQTKNVFKQKGPYVSNPSVKPQQAEKPPGKRRKAIPASASKPFIRRTSINPYAGFWNTKKKGERAYIGDISGKKLRSKNYETPRIPPEKPIGSPYSGYLKKKRIGDKSYSGKAAGGHVSKSRPGKAWIGDISGRKIRDLNRSSKGKPEPGKPLIKLPYTGARINGFPNKNRFAPTDMQKQGEGFSGFYKTRRPQKGGGSVSGKSWNNNQQPLIGKSPGIGARAGNYQGNIKARKKEPVDVGGVPRNKSYSHVTMRRQGEGFSGYIKARQPKKGGGSVSGKLWNNNEQPLVGKSPGIGARAGNYQGNIKARKKEPVDVGGIPPNKVYSHVTMRKQGEDFTGYNKTKKPKKGGGSVSGKLWNNKEQAIAGRGPKGSDLEMGSYQGNVRPAKKGPGAEIDAFPGKHRQFDFHTSMRDQGEEFTGYIRVRKLKNDYVQNPYAVKSALKKNRPGKTVYSVDGLQVRVKEKDYKNKPNAADGSMPGIAPGKSSIKASEYARSMKQDWKYVRNESSDDEALRVKETGKAFGRVSDYQGNVKMKKFELFAKKNLHPDAQFVKTNKNNVKEEKNLVTNFKLLWARWFKKSDTQPNNLKENIKKPRYDKGEIGLWND